MVEVIMVTVKIAFKHATDAEHFPELKPKLRGIVFDLAYFCLRHFNKTITVTSLFRLDNKRSVHHYGRGADVRSRNFSPQEIGRIDAYLNTTYAYDPSRPKKPTCLYHNSGQGDHFHLQVME